MSSINQIFKVSLFGESHGVAVGIVIDGCPAGIAVNEQLFADDLLRRKAGKTGTTPRQEKDVPEIISGVWNGFTTGAPITIIFNNNQQKETDYQYITEFNRPGHADFVAEKKYHGFADLRGGGHFSGRLTVALTASGVIAKQIIKPISIHAQLVEAGGNANIEKNVEDAVRQGDSIGGIVSCSITNVPVGLGEPFFDGIESVISHAVFAIPGIKGIAFGSGFNAANMKGSEHNDMVIDEKGTTKTNHAGGINGGISNGNEIYFTVAVKPTASILRPQQTWNHHTKMMNVLQIKGRHDACFALRTPVIIEAATAIALADLWLRKK
jgi:chorismate synthase